MPYEPLATRPSVTLPTLTDTQIDEWFTNWVGQLSPPEQQQVKAQWDQLSTAQKNLVQTDAGYGGPPTSVQQALQFVTQTQQQTDAQGQPKAEDTPVSTSATGAAPTQATTGILSNSPSSDTTPAPTGTPVQGTTAATSLINQYMSTPLWQGGENDPQSAASTMGIDFNSADAQYQQYLTSFASAQRRSGVYNASVTPMPETQFIQGLAMTQYGQWGPAIGMIAYMWQQQNGTAMPPDLAQGLISQLKAFAARDPNGAAQLQFQMLSTVTQIESSAKGTTGTSGEATNLNLSVDITNFLTQMGGIAPSIYNGGSSGSSALANASPDSYIGQYNAKNPNATALEATQEGTEKTNAINFLSQYGMALTPSNIAKLTDQETFTTMGDYVAWMKQVEMPITGAVLQTLLAMPPGDPMTSSATAGTGGAYLMDQMVPGTKMTYGAYQQVSSQITPQWEQYFNAAPTKAQLAYFVGKSSEDVTDYFDNSMSSIPGITIGQKNDYESFINSLDTQSPTVNGITHTFSSQLDDSMMDQLHQQVTAQSTAKPTPGAMP